MNNILEQLIKEVISEEDLKKEIALYKINSQKISELQDSVKEVLNQIKTQNDEETKRLKLIIKYMSDFNISKTEGDNWVATLEEVPMYKYPSSSYKELWEAALKKLNKSTQDVLKQLENEQLTAKAAMKKKELKITENIVSKGINWLIDKWSNLLQAIKGYKNIIKSLPSIDINKIQENIKENIQEQEQELNLNVVGSWKGIETRTLGIENNKINFIVPSPENEVILFDQSPHRIVKKLKKLFPDIKDIWITPYKGPYNNESTIKVNIENREFLAEGAEIPWEKRTVDINNSSLKGWRVGIGGLTHAIEEVRREMRGRTGDELFDRFAEKVQKLIHGAGMNKLESQLESLEAELEELTKKRAKWGP